MKVQTQETGLARLKLVARRQDDNTIYVLSAWYIGSVPDYRGDAQCIASKYEFLTPAGSLQPQVARYLSQWWTSKGYAKSSSISDSALEQLRAPPTTSGTRRVEPSSGSTNTVKSEQTPPLTRTSLLILTSWREIFDWFRNQGWVLSEDQCRRVLEVKQDPYFAGKNVIEDLWTTLQSGRDFEKKLAEFEGQKSGSQDF